MLRTGRAVEADHLDRHVLHDRERGGDIGAKQHAAGGIEGDRGLDWNSATRPSANTRIGGMNGGLQLENVLDGLDDQNVGAAVDKPADLVEEEIDDLLESMLAEHRVFGGREETGGADRAGDEARAGRGAVLVGDAAGDLCGGAVLFVGAVP